MKVFFGFLLIVGAFLALVYLSNLSMPQPYSPSSAQEDKVEVAWRKQFCANSPIERDLIVALAWEKERERRGSPWRNGKEYSDALRRNAGC